MDGTSYRADGTDTKAENRALIVNSSIKPVVEINFRVQCTNAHILIPVTAEYALGRPKKSIPQLLRCGIKYVVKVC